LSLANYPKRQEKPPSLRKSMNKNRHCPACESLLDDRIG
jgi:hypothetical protein